jgi:hypothetical protein
MWGSAEMADMRCAFTYLAAQHCLDRQADVLVPHCEHCRGTRASPPPLPHHQWRRRRRGRRWARRSRGFLRGGRVHRSVGKQSQPKHLNVLSEKKIRYCQSETLSLWQRINLIESAQQSNIHNILINTMCIECISHIHIIQAWYSQPAAFKISSNFLPLQNLQNKSIKPTK